MNQFNFYFHSKTIKPPFKSSRMYNFWNYFSTECPYTHSINVFDSYSEIESFNPIDTVNIIVVPMNKPYFLHMEEHEPNWLDICNKLNDRTQRNVLVLDYSNESELPGNFSLNEKWKQNINLQMERWHLTTIANKIENHNIRMPVAAVFYDWNVCSTVLYERYYLNGEENAAELLSWRDKTAPIKFLYPNRVARKHRLDFIVTLHERGLLEQTDWSMLYPDSTAAGISKDYNDDHAYFGLFGRDEKLMQYFPEWSKDGYTNQSTSGLLPEDTSYLGYVAVDTYSSTEDRVRKDLPEEPSVLLDISEKLVKGFAQGLPTFYFGTYKSIEWITENGFWLPEGRIEHSDDHIRREAVLDAMSNFGDTITGEMMDGIIHNRNLILDKKFLYSQSSQLINFLFRKFYC